MCRCFSRWLPLSQVPHSRAAAAACCHPCSIAICTTEAKLNGCHAASLDPSRSFHPQPQAHFSLVLPPFSGVKARCLPCWSTQANSQMNFGAIDKENIAEAFANVRLFSPSRNGGGAKHSGGALERSLLKSQAAALSAFHCSEAAPRAVLATPAHSHSILSTSSSLVCAPKRAAPAKKTGLSERARRTPLFSTKDSASAHSGADAQATAQLCSAGISKGSR